MPLLFLTRSLRLLGFGALSVVLVLYLSARGLTETALGLLLTATLLGDTALALWLTTRADRWGRRRVLAAGAGLMAAGALLMALTGAPWLLLLGATLGIISPSGNEVGPFLAIEQAALAQIVPAARRTAVLAWYNLAGFGATALGALAGGAGVTLLQNSGWTPLASYQAVFLAYAALGLLLVPLFLRLDQSVEAAPAALPVVRSGLGLTHSRRIVLRLAGLFSVDAFAGGFIVQSVLAFWFQRRFGVDEATLGALFCGANLLSGASALAAAPLARRIGLVNTMVFTHLPSNVLLMLIPAMPTFGGALALLLARHLISQMDVPTRQAYVMAVVTPEERSAANGVTGVARTLGSALSPALAGALLAVPGWSAAPLLLAGGLKIVYDLALWTQFRHHQPLES